MKRANIALLLAVSACAGPRPSAPLAAQISAPPAWRSEGATMGEVDSTWWQSFGDPTLVALVERALADNADLGIAAARVDEARAQFRLAGAQRLPNIALAAGGARDRHVSPFGKPVYEWASQGQVGISYDIDLFGRLRSADAAARASLLASEAARDNVRLAIAASVSSGYVGLRALDARLVVLRDTLAARETSLRLARRRAEAGYSPAIELRQAQAEYDATAQLIPATELALRRQENGLSLLLGANPGPIPRGQTLDQLALPPASSFLPSSLLRRRPDIAAAENQIVAADRSLDSARAAFLPDIQLNGAGGYVASSLLLQNPFGVFSLGASVLAPLFDGGRLRAQADGAAARRDAAAFAYRQTALNAFREVEDALAAISYNSLQEQEVLRQRRSTADLLGFATARYRSGYSAYLEQIDAERGLLASDLALVQIRAERLTAAIALYQALGGGWSADGVVKPRSAP
ncbi:efflux transporter outer membrane subunit [Sphingomonas sp. M1-B02]|uniref:efflux transporter outer membrane subunit n=1 Tax=Sphingomonas sp. M1-B02 TaxID=3114300 RepID=UPI00223FE581|nr:efflux transporter outer membrane subunit [Sphingomonas sp. S6-11]UZK66312.1 efflux transporter outer membrane subunit [Sphingomonas sp. S6-11]